MAFTISSVAVKDGAGVAVGGGILAADIAGGGVGPFFFFHGLVDGVAGVNKVQVDASNRLAVLATLVAGGDVDVLSVVPGTAATNLGKAEDAAHSSGDVGVMALAVRQDAQSDFGADNDYVPLSVDADGGLRVSVLGAVGLAQNQDTAGQTASLVLGAVTAAVPSYTTAKSSALSLDVAGNLRVNQQPHSVGGFAAPFVSIDLDESSEPIKGSAGVLYKLRLTNFATSARYVRLYDHATPTVGSTTKVDLIVLPAGSATAPTVVTESWGGHGIPFGTAISIAATTGLADADTGAPGANEVVASAYYK